MLSIVRFLTLSHADQDVFLPFFRLDPPQPQLDECCHVFLPPGSPEADITSTHPRRDTTPCRSASHVSMERFLVRKRPRTEGG